jgi:hypothetical protein
LSQTSALTSGLAQRVSNSAFGPNSRRMAHIRQAVALLSRGCSTPELPAQYRRLTLLAFTSVSRIRSLVAASGGVVVAQRGSALPQATLQLCWRFDRSFGTRRRALLPGVLTRLRPPSGCTDVK